MLFCIVSEKARLEIWGKPQEVQQEPRRSLWGEPFPPSQCALVLLPQALAGVLYLLFLPPGSPLAANGAPWGELQQRSKSLLPGCFLFTQQKQRSRAHLETQIKSRALCLAGILFVFSLLRRNLAEAWFRSQWNDKAGTLPSPIQAKEWCPIAWTSAVHVPTGCRPWTWSGTRTREDPSLFLPSDCKLEKNPALVQVRWDVSPWEPRREGYQVVLSILTARGQWHGYRVRREGSVSNVTGAGEDLETWRRPCGQRAQPVLRGWRRRPRGIANYFQPFCLSVSSVLLTLKHSPWRKLYFQRKPLGWRFCTRCIVSQLLGNLPREGRKPLHKSARGIQALQI